MTHGKGSRPRPPCPLPLAAPTSALLYPVTLSLSLCSSLFMMDTLPSPIACAGSPAERTDKLFSAAGLGLGEEGLVGAPPHHSRPDGAQPPLEYERGMTLRSFLNAKECRKLPDQLVNQ